MVKMWTMFCGGQATVHGMIEVRTTGGVCYKAKFLKISVQMSPVATLLD